ncbi:hypothetical protein GCM10010911_66050 [Paenibacillus nasutitermitis]|uniref:Uncharacterized protein n=1 Tax=Paenibacillus nasutitermitis TaxID=1652958 RepID=A0A916ZHB8_9BACL|nr:hypothetical protein GCM10010911_66050 [Paenibacillus nasutitermitis]
MENDKEIKELKERLTIVENKLQHKSQASNIIRFVLGFIIVFVLLLISIGVIQFISSSSS